MTKKKRNSNINFVFISFLLLCAVTVNGCRKHSDTAKDELVEQLPDYTALLDRAQTGTDGVEDECPDVPVRVYYSADLYNFKDCKEREGDTNLDFCRLIQCLNSLRNKNYQIQYYENVEEVFQKEDSSYLADPGFINVLVTDLEESELDKIMLADSIKKYCEEEKCAVYLYAFRFDYYAVVPEKETVQTV